jgi:hypothetical protein
MNDPVAWVLDTFRRVFARAPREDELSLYLHRLLLGAIDPAVLEREMIAAAGTQPPSLAGRIAARLRK